MFLTRIKKIVSCCVPAACLLSGGGTTVKAQLFTFTSPVGGAIQGSSVDGTNAAAHFNLPVCVACDADGNVYVADGDGQVVRKMEAIGKDWVVTTIAGK